MNSWRLNQERAINETLSNNFKSGVHFHATGTGKSWIALELLLKYNEKYKNKNIVWLCEQKTILKEQFNKATIINKGYTDIYKNFLIINYSEKKTKRMV